MPCGWRSWPGWSRCRCGAPSRTPSAWGPTTKAFAPCATAPCPRCTSAPCPTGWCPGCAPPARPQQGGNARSLPKHLQKPAQAPADERNTIVIAGCEAHVCLLQTALELIGEEFDVWVVTDACSSRTERNRDAAFDRLAGAGAELVTTEMVAFEWMRSCENPVFKDMLKLVK